MHDRFHAIAGRATSAILALSVFAATAAAQSGLNPPENETGIEGKPWLTGFVALIAVAVVLIGAFLKPKRGHQD